MTKISRIFCATKEKNKQKEGDLIFRKSCLSTIPHGWSRGLVPMNKHPIQPKEFATTVRLYDNAMFKRYFHMEVDLHRCWCISNPRRNFGQGTVPATVWAVPRLQYSQIEAVDHKKNLLRIFSFFFRKTPNFPKSGLKKEKIGSLQKRWFLL